MEKPVAEVGAGGSLRAVARDGGSAFPTTARHAASPDGLPGWAGASICAPQDHIAPAFEVLRPTRQTVPIVFNTPHSGRAYPPGFLGSARLDLRDLRGSEDAFVDTLLEGVTTLGAPLLRAHFPRAYLDVNREPFELDPRLFGPLPPYANTRSLRVAAGLGTIARVVADAKEIYADPARPRRGDGADRGLLRALSPCPARTGRGDGLALRCLPPHRRPFDAVAESHRRADDGPRRAGRRATGALRARRPARRVLLAGRHAGRPRRPRPAAAISSAATRPMPAATSPSITAGRTRACTSFRSRSTAASTWTRRALPPIAASAKSSTA